MYAPIGVSQGHGGSRVYNLSQCKSLPEFMAEALKENKSLRKNKEFKERIEVIQGFEFSTSCAKVVVSKDRRYIGAIGMYPPDLKVYDTQDLSMKFQRRFDCELLDLLFLTDDYRKLVTLQNDRFLEFHNQGGRHHRMRLPTHGRQLNYNEIDAELIITASDVYRLDLSEGKFKESLRTIHEEPSVCSHSSANSPSPYSSSAASSSKEILYVGGDQPVVEIYDTRSGVCSIDQIHLASSNDIGPAETTALALDQKYSMAIGNSRGLVSIHDLRMPHAQPVCEKRHLIDEPIRDLHFITIRNDIDTDWAIASADAWQVKVWRPTSDKVQNYATFEGQGKINSICPCPESGLIFVAQDYPRVGVHFLPAVGLAPSWSPFIDQIINDVGSSSESGGLANHDFLTHADLGKLGLEKSDSRLTPYQHGFLIATLEHQSILSARELLSLTRLRDYQAAKDIARLDSDNPFGLQSISNHAIISPSVDIKRSARGLGSTIADPGGLPQVRDVRFAALGHEQSF